MMKIGTLMDLPSVVLVEKLVVNGNRQVHYPAPLLEVWMRSTQPEHDSPSGQIFFTLNGQFQLKEQIKR